MFRIVTLSAVLFGFVSAANASWYWPFDTDPDSTNKPPRLHRLMAKANDLIEQAEDEAIAGNADKSIEYYREALKELDRVAAENPDRATTPEFAPLRSKRATCAGAIDTIRFAQVNDNEKAVAVSNTAELERKWRKKHGMETPEDLPAKVIENKIPVPKSDGSLEQDVKAALVHLRNGDYVRADSMMEKTLEKNPKHLNALLIRAAAQMGSGNMFASRRTLESAMRYHPKSYLPYYNLANLVLQIGEEKSVARDYYEMGRAQGGPKNEALEKKLK